MGEWEKLSDNEQDQRFIDINTWNLGCKNNSKNGHQVETNNTNMNRQIKQLQDSLDSSKHSFEYLPETAADSYENSFDPSNSIKGIKFNK